MAKVRYKKSEAIKRFENFAFKKKQEANPNFPYIVKSKYSDNTSNTLTKCVIDCINLSGGQAERINSIGRQIKTKGSTKWIKGSGQIGTADISATIKGRSVKIEIKCKASGDKTQSEHQKKYQQAIEQAGGIYIIVRDFEGFYEWLNKFFKYGQK